MLLSDNTLKDYMSKGLIDIKPPVKDRNIRPVGIRIHLGGKILVPKPDQIIDPTSDQEVGYKEHYLDDNDYILSSNEFVLGATMEQINVDKNIVAILDGRSTMARLGLAIHCSSFVVDGIHGDPRAIVLEIKNFSPYSILLKRFMAVGMLSFMLLTDNVQQDVQTQYSGQVDVLAPNLKNQFM